MMSSYGKPTWKNFRFTHHPGIERKVYLFCEVARQANFPVTQDWIRERTLLMKKTLLKSKSLSEASRSCLKKFTASVVWRQKFVKRHPLTSVSLHCDCGFKSEVTQVSPGVLSQLLSPSHRENIYVHSIKSKVSREPID